MSTNAILNALNASLVMSSRYPGLLLDKTERTDGSTLYYYYNQNGKLHNDAGPAVVVFNKHDLVETELWYHEGEHVSVAIKEIIEEAGIERCNDGFYNLTEAEQLTIAMALGN